MWTNDIWFGETKTHTHHCVTHRWLKGSEQKQNSEKAEEKKSDHYYRQEISNSIHSVDCWTPIETNWWNYVEWNYCKWIEIGEWCSSSNNEIQQTKRKENWEIVLWTRNKQNQNQNSKFGGCPFVNCCIVLTISTEFYRRGKFCEKKQKKQKKKKPNRIRHWVTAYPIQ